MTDPTRAEAKEALKGGQVPDLRELPHIPFDIGLHIIAIGLRRVEALVVDARIEASKQKRIDTGVGRRGPEFLQRKG